MFDDDVDAGEDAGEDDAAAPLDLGEDLDALLEADSLDDSADEEDAPLPGDAADDEASGRLLDDAFDSEPEPEEARVVLGGPVTDAFSQLVLAMRAKGHGETTTADAGAATRMGVPGGLSVPGATPRGVAARLPPPARNKREPMRPLAPTTSPWRPFTAMA